ncbi:MAG: ATP-binding protein [Candidatus Nanoarchaeia archaeon]|nr:ATP-binding protein [Candidatus Nanoarchaeia archaeon]
MKLAGKPTTVTTSAVFQELSFGIKEADMGLILEILRSKLYSNPIGAICREVSSNSRDANREAENNVPIEIGIANSHLSMSDMVIYFKDFGTGISPERMADVFVNYGSSTKRESDTFTGGFGLGAKTPFSYTDNFTIETIVAGIKYTYVAAIEQGRKGKIYCIDTAETQEANGTTILVPIKSGDRTNFEQECYKATIFWPMRPVYKNFGLKLERLKIETVLDNDQFMIVKQDFLGQGYGLLLDGIFYPISSSQINWAGHTIYDHQVIFKFPVGVLTISANREHVQYDEKTKSAINLAFVAFINEVKSVYQTEFKKCTTWLQAALFYQSTKQGTLYKYLDAHLSGSDPYWKEVKNFDGRQLSLRLDSHFQTLQFFDVENDNGKVTRTKTTEIGDALLKGRVFLFDATMAYIPLKDATIFAGGNEYMAIRPTEPKYLRYNELNKDERKSINKGYRRYRKDLKALAKLGIAYSLYSHVEKMKVTKEAAAKIPSVRQPDTLKVWIQYFSNAGSYSRRHGSSSKPGTYQYIKVDGNQVASESGSPFTLANYALVLVDDILQIPNIAYEDAEYRMLRIAMNAKLVPEFNVIYANRNRGARLLGLIESLDAKRKLLTPAIITKLVDASNISTVVGDKTWLWTYTYTSKTFTDLMATIKSLTINLDISMPSDLMEKYAASSQLSTLKAQVETMYKTFPMLSLLSRYELEYSGKTVVQEYINDRETILMQAGKLV